MTDPLHGVDQLAAVERAYDAVAEAYLAAHTDELDHKPLDRMLLEEVCRLARGGQLADVGCGPGHISRFLGQRHDDVVGVDLSERMIAVARRHAPTVRFVTGSVLSLPFPSATLSGAVALYSLIHLPPPDRGHALAEMARVLRADSFLLVAIHVSSDSVPSGGRRRVQQFLGQDVDMDGYFIDPLVLAQEMENAGLEVTATLTRRPVPEVEFPSERAYLLSRRRP